MTQPEATLKPAAGSIAHITNLSLCDIAIERALSRSANLPGIVSFYGPSGFGKSMAANYVANARRAFYVQAPGVRLVVAFELSYQEESEVQVEGETNVFC